MEKIAIIDLGSNTARMILVDILSEGHFVITDQLKETPRIGEGMEKDGFLKPSRISATIDTLKMFRKLCDAYNVEKIIAVATAAVRRAKNQRSFLDEVFALRTERNVYFFCESNFVLCFFVFGTAEKFPLVVVNAAVAVIVFEIPFAV